jgi:hypothetical protein
LLANSLPGRRLTEILGNHPDRVPKLGGTCPRPRALAGSRKQPPRVVCATGAERRRCRDWLLPFMQNGQPKFLTKDELRVASMRQLNVLKSSFDFAWIDAIEKTGRYDWYEPLRRRPRTKT